MTSRSPWGQWVKQWILCHSHNKQRVCGSCLRCGRQCTKCLSNRHQLITVAIFCTHIIIIRGKQCICFVLYYLWMLMHLCHFFFSIYSHFHLPMYFYFANISPKFAPCCLEYDYTYLPYSGVCMYMSVCVGLCLCHCLAGQETFWIDFDLNWGQIMSWLHGLYELHGPWCP